MPRIPRENHASSPAAIKAKRDFDCTNMSGRIIGNHGLNARYDAGELSGSDLAAFQTDASAIRYVVWSYNTPIAWCTLSGRWHIVRQRFSVSTSKHQGRLYLLPRDGGEDTETSATRSTAILTETEDGTYYTGPLAPAVAAMRAEYGTSLTVKHDTEAGYYIVAEHRHGEADNPNQWGKGETEEEAWRYFIGVDFGPLDATYYDENYEAHQRAMLGLTTSESV